MNVVETGCRAFSSISQAAAECYDAIVGSYVGDVARQVARKEFETACNDAIAQVCVAGRACYSVLRFVNIQQHVFVVSALQL
jgi:hypothetical protein